jgi:hypothetical protein
MLKETVNYTDFNGNPKSEDVYFNITRAELSENLKLVERLETLQVTFGGPERVELTTEQVEEMLNLVKDFVKLSYGERSGDGRRFIKDEPPGSGHIWVEFKQSAVFDEFLMGLFKDPEKILSFIMGILPADWAERAKAELANQPVRPQPQDRLQKQTREREATVTELPQTTSVPVAPRVVETPEDFEAFLAWKRQQEQDKQ